MYNIIQKRKIWLSLSGLLVGLSIMALIIWSLNFGIDFTGGSLLEVRFVNERPSVNQVTVALAQENLASLTVQPAGTDGLILRFQDISEEKHQQILKLLSDLNGDNDQAAEADSQPAAADPVKVEAEGLANISLEAETSAGDKIEQLSPASGASIEELRFESVGPSIGQELKIKSVYAIITVILAIVFYIAWAFRQVSKPVASWKYGLSAIIALFHDVIIVLGVFAVLGKFLGTEINTAFVAAILTVLGYSVNDTIVVFDRIRENLPRSDDDFEGTVNTSINQTLTRSINTSLTTLLVLLAIFFFGGASIRDFILALSLGVIVGTYSSIFLASPLLVIWERLKLRN